MRKRKGKKRSVGGDSLDGNLEDCEVDVDFDFDFGGIKLLLGRVGQWGCRIRYGEAII